MAGGMWGCVAGGMHGAGRAWGACMVGGGGACMAGGVCGGGGRVWQIQRDTVNERAVRILLECILVLNNFTYI